MRKKKIKKNVPHDYNDEWTVYDELDDWDVAESLYIDCDFDDDPDMSNIDFEDEVD